MDLEATPTEAPSTEPDEEADEAPDGDAAALDEDSPSPPPPSTPTLKEDRRVFISTGRTKKVVDQLKELLAFGDFEPVFLSSRRPS